MDANETIANRRAVREYTSQPIDETMIRHLIDSAVLAPSAFNEQPWRFTVIRDRKILDQISSDAKAHMIETLSADSRSDRLRSELQDPDFQIFHHAPTLIVVSAAMEGPFVIEDCALAAENLMLTACSLGLGSCWIGFAQSYLNTATGKKTLGCPASWVQIAPIIVGYPKSVPSPAPRNTPEIHWVG